MENKSTSLVLMNEHRVWFAPLFPEGHSPFDLAEMYVQQAKAVGMATARHGCQPSGLQMHRAMARMQMATAKSKRQRGCH